MKRLIYIIFFFTNFAIGQESMLYRADRKLLIDTTFQIDIYSYENLINLEKVLLPMIYNGIKYPEIARENNQEGIVIVCVSISNSINTFTFNIVKSDYEILKETTNNYFSNISDFTKEQIKPEYGTITIYIPMMFKINHNKYIETLKHNKSVTIETNDIAKQTIIIKDR